MTATSASDRLRDRAKRMLELANRARCEKHYDFAHLLTQLAAEAFEHAKEIERPEIFEHRRSGDSRGLAEAKNYRF